MDMNAFMASLTPEQQAALAAASKPAATPSPRAAKAAKAAKIGTAKPAPMPSDDSDDDETVSPAVAAVSVKLKANGSTLPIKAPGAMIGPDTHGRSLPASALPVRVVFHFADGSQQSLSMTPKVFSSGGIGSHGTGKVSVDSPDGRPLQANVILTYVKPKAE